MTIVNFQQVYITYYLLLIMVDYVYVCVCELLYCLLPISISICYWNLV